MGTNAYFSRPKAFLALRDGSGIVVSDRHNHRIRLIDTSTLAVRTIAGSGKTGRADGDALHATIEWPETMVFDSTAVIPESVVFISSGSALRRLALPTCMCGPFAF